MASAFRSALRRPVTAAAIVLVSYGLLSLMMDPRGYLGTDTGGKVATLESMVESRSRGPDIGYWAEDWDRDGVLHPLFFTSRVGDQWVNVTTLPMIYAALPLYELGGYRLALLIPMVGAVAAAFAARAVARRVGGGDGWAAFWLAALASPLVIYALDLWEHTVGVALIAWGILAAFDWVERDRPALGVLAGLAFGTAFTLRAEAGVYAVVTAVVVSALLVQRRRWRALVSGGVLLALGAAIAVGLNVLLERAVLDEPTRASRSTDAVSRGLSSVASRLDEGLITTVAMFPSRASLMVVAGFVFTGGACVLAAMAPPTRRPQLLVALAGVLGAIILLRVSTGPGFVPGLVPATPLAAVALVFGWRGGRSGMFTTVAVGSIPAVWAFQYLGGARPQWGGRYVLASGLLLGAIGIVKAVRLGWVRWWFVGAAVAITAFGLVWQSVRTHEVASARTTLEARDEPVLVSRQAFFLRELGSAFAGRQWLTVPRARDFEQLEAVLEGADVDRFALLQTDDQGELPAVSDFAIVDEEQERWLRGDFTIVVYERRMVGNR